MTLTAKSSLQGRQIMTCTGEVLTIRSLKGYYIRAFRPGSVESQNPDFDLTFHRQNVELIPDDEPYSVRPDSDTSGFLVEKKSHLAWFPNRELAEDYARKCNVGAFRSQWMKERGL